MFENTDIYYSRSRICADLNSKLKSVQTKSVVTHNDIEDVIRICERLYIKNPDVKIIKKGAENE